jgi:hypothetical protein
MDFNFWDKSWFNKERVDQNVKCKESGDSILCNAFFN